MQFPSDTLLPLLNSFDELTAGRGGDPVEIAAALRANARDTTLSSLTARYLVTCARICDLMVPGLEPATTH